MSIRIKCPPATLPKEQRIAKLFENIREWILSSSTNELLELYEADINYEGDLKKYIQRVHDFTSQNWDFRAKQRKANQKNLERYGLKEDPFVLENKELVLKCAAELGLMDITEPVIEPNYILPLGGARLTNIARPMMAKKIIDDNSWKNKEIKIVALTGTRPLTKTDYPSLKQYDNKDVCETSTATKKIYMPNGGQMPERCEHDKRVYKTDVMTEFDAMNLGLEKTFELSENCTGSYSKNVNINLNAEMREYDDKYGKCAVYSLAVESSNPEKGRANSVDTFNGFVKKFKLNNGDKVLLVTSAIYVPWQGLRFYKLGLELGIDVDCVGVDSSIEGTQFSLATNYLQEIKATVDTIYALSEAYL